MEFHDLAWWEAQLGLDKAGRAQLEADLQVVCKELPKPAADKDTYTKLLEVKGEAWERIFNELGVDDSLDGFSRTESFLGGVLSSDLATNQEGCLYAGGISVDGRAGFVWKAMDTYDGHGYISSTEAGRLMNDEGFQQSLANRFPSLIKDVLGGDPSETDSAGKPRGGWSRAGKLFDSDTGVLGKSKYGDVLGLNDFFSERYVSSLRCSDVETFFMGDPCDVVQDKGGNIVPKSVKVSMRTELDTLMKNNHVKTVNGVSKNFISAVYKGIPESADKFDVARKMTNFMNVTALNRACDQYVKWQPKLNDAGVPTGDGTWKFTNATNPDAIRFLDIYASGEPTVNPSIKLTDKMVLTPDFAQAYSLLEESKGISDADRIGARGMLDLIGLQWRATILADHEQIVKLNGGKPVERVCGLMNDAGKIISTTLKIDEHGVTEGFSSGEVSLADRVACILDDGTVRYIDKSGTAVGGTRFTISMEAMSKLTGDGVIRKQCRDFDSLDMPDKLLARIGADALKQRGISIDENATLAKELTKFAEAGIAEGTKPGRTPLVCHFDQYGKFISVTEEGAATGKHVVLSIELTEIREFGNAETYTSQIKDYDKLTGLNRLRALRGIQALQARGLTFAPGTDAIDLAMLGETYEPKNAGKTYHGVFDAEGRFRGMDMPKGAEAGLFKADIADVLGTSGNDAWIDEHMSEGKKLTGIARLRASRALGVLQRAGYTVLEQDANKLENIGKLLEDPDGKTSLIFDEKDRLVGIDTGKELAKGTKRYSIADIIQASGVSDLELKDTFGDRGMIVFGEEPGGMTTAQAKMWCVVENNFLRATNVNNLSDEELKKFCESYDANRIKWGFEKQVPSSAEIMGKTGLGSVGRILVSSGRTIGNTEAMRAVNSLFDAAGGHKCLARIGAMIEKGTPLKTFGAFGTVLMAADTLRLGYDICNKINAGDYKGAISDGIEFGLTWGGGVEGMKIGMMIGCAIGGPLGMVIGMGIGTAMGVGAGYLSKEVAPFLADLLFRDWKGAKDARYDPLVIDLDGNGFDITDRKNGTYFDLNADGYAEKTDWTRTDGWLALDLNGNGKIDDGSELFGDHTKLADGSFAADGFAALAQYDTNGDGVIDAQDDIFSQLRIWRDANGNGQSDSGELIGLAEAGVSSISLKTEKPSESSTGEAEISGTAQVVFADGTSKTIGELWAKTNLYDTIEMDDGTAGSTTRLLNYSINNHGTLPSLAHAVAGEHGDIILADLQAFTSETDMLKRFSIIDDMLYTMAGARDVQQDAFGSYVDARHLMVDEAFMGEKFQGQWGRKPNQTAGPQLENIYENIRNSYCFSLMSQIPGNEMFSSAIIERDENGKASVDLGALEFLLIASSLKGELKESTVKDVAAYVAFLSTAVAHDANVFVGFYGMVASQLPEMTKAMEGGAAYSAICGSNDGDSLTGDGIHQLMFGGDGNDTLNAGSTDGALFGGEGDDRLFGGSGDDVLVGGAGDDVLDGGYGNDSYIFNAGFGTDKISDSYGSNSITFHDYQVRDLSAQRDGNNLNLAFKKTGDSVTISDYYCGSSYRNFSYSFDDGTKLSNDDIASIMNGTYAYANVEQQTDQLAQQLAAPASDITASDTSSSAVSQGKVSQDATSQLWVVKQ